MTKYVALLRGINVGGNCKVPMPELKKIFESLGFTEVSTYINSGNVIFTSATKPSVQTIEKALHKHFDFPIKTIIRDNKSIQKLNKALPANWTNDPSQKTDILFLWDKFDKKETLTLIKQNPAADTLLYVPGAIAWNVNRKHYNQSGMRKFIGSLVYKNMTARNINTVRKLAELLK